MKLALALLIAFVPSLARADDTAGIAYRHAEELVKQGKWAEACPFYEASYRADAQVGVLLHLADCDEHVGKIASAWIEFTDAVELAHRKGDNRESLAQQRADALKPRLAHLRLNPPASPPPGLTVRRDGVDITVLVGTDMPIDPGDHELAAAAPGYLDWKKKLTIGALATATAVDIPALEKIPEKPVDVPTPVPPPKPVEARPTTLAVFAQPGAQIAVDDKPVGAGHYEGAVAPGRHTLRVTATGAKPYRSEVYVNEGESRSIEVPLELERAALPPVGPAEELPSFELGLGFAPGEKGHGDHPAMIAYRFDAGFRFGHRVNFGAFVEYATISASGACGTDIPGAMLSGPYDFGTHYQFTGCRYFMPGLQLYVHVLPKRQLDPWIGVTPGFRFAFFDTTTYDALGQPHAGDTKMFPGILANVRAGVDYHPVAELAGWAVGAFFDTQITFIGDENFDNASQKGQTYVSFFGGLRSSIAF